MYLHRLAVASTLGPAAGTLGSYSYSGQGYRVDDQVSGLMPCAHCASLWAE